MAAGSAMISASLFAPVSLADLDAKRMPKNVAAVAKKPGTKETAPADGGHFAAGQGDDSEAGIEAQAQGHERISDRAE
jgi:hypothetical protein